MFFDGLVFIVYYALWALFIVARYQQGQFEISDKIRVGMAVAAALLILPGVVPNAFGLYTLDYDIAIWSPHMVLFVVFGVLTVFKLIRCSRRELKQTSDSIIQTQERALSIVGIGLAFSFLFFILSLALIPVNEKLAMFMIPKTFAYMTAFIYLIKGVIIPAR
jgi:peptidoglycan/LPS O-acetylase OafA/YrhL